MIRFLHITNFALIKDLEIDFERGMTVLTGETGSGKSLILEALALLNGSRASASFVRQGAEKAQVEAILDFTNLPSLRNEFPELLHDHELDEVILRREISKHGRSRCSVNGKLTTITQLNQLTRRLFEIHGQHEQLLLTQPGHFRDFYDRFFGLINLREEMNRHLLRVRELKAERERLASEEKTRSQKLDFMRFQFQQLEEANISPGELDQLERQIKSIESREEISAAVNRSLGALSEAESSDVSALDLIHIALESLKKIKDERVKPVLEKLEGAAEVISEVSFDISRLDQFTSQNDEIGLDELNQRCVEIKALLRKYGPTEEDAKQLYESLKEQLDSSEDFGLRDEELRKQISEMEFKCLKTAEKLSRARKKSAKSLIAPLESILRDFAMPNVKIKMDFPENTTGLELGRAGKLCTAGGLEEMALLISTNEGERLEPIQNVASGGELSRIMLALRALNAKSTSVPVMVFDEVDSGISGSAARAVAEKLSMLSSASQIVCVTHNPSVASEADHHLVVSKYGKEGRTESRVDYIQGVQRESELARLLDGGKASEKGRELAAELLAQSA